MSEWPVTLQVMPFDAYEERWDVRQVVVETSQF
jgi:hypothetical protein